VKLVRSRKKSSTPLNPGVASAEAAGINIVTDVDRTGIRSVLKAAYRSNLNDQRTIALVELAGRSDQ
jgi:hypothetical protein